MLLAGRRSHQRKHTIVHRRVIVQTGCPQMSTATPVNIARNRRAAARIPDDFDASGCMPCSQPVTRLTRRGAMHYSRSFMCTLSHEPL